MSDPVNKPAHYTQGGIETIDSIRASTGDGFIWYCVGNADKYIGRCRYKGKLLEDLRKCRDYVDWAIEEAEKLEAAGESGNCPVIPDSSSRKPLPIPAGWRELEPDEVPKANDMHEWMGVWYYRNDDATHEYKWHSSRNIRKIEPGEPGPIAIPEGWRELKPDEFPKVTDLYENEGAWRNRIDDSSFLYARYEVRHIRKIEPANPSETQNSSAARPGYFDDVDGVWVDEPNPFEGRKIEAKPTEWIPKVGDKVWVVCATPFPKEDRFGIVVKDNVRPREDLFLVKTSNGIFSWFYTSELELIEAAS
jgi:hypothetical protein